MLNNWEDAQDSLTTALISGGSAIREFEKYMDSIEYKSGVLKSSLTNLWSEALSAGVLKGVIDAGIRFVETIDVMVNHTDYLSAVILPGLVSALLLKVVPALITSIGAMKTATTAAVMMNAAINPLLAAVTLATVGFGLYSSTVAHAERQKREYIETTERELELAESEGKAANVLAEQYDKLKDKVGETEEGKKKLDKIISHLIKINPDLEEGIDGQKLSYDNLSTAVQRTIDKMNELQRASRAALMDAYKADLKAIYDAREELEKRIEYEQKRTPTRMTEGLSEVLMSSYKSQLNKLNEDAREIGKKIQSIYSPFSSPPGIDPGDDDGSGWPGGSAGSGSPYASKLSLTYRDLQTAIENVGFELDKLKEKEKSLSGTDLINNLQQQNNLTKQRIQLLEELNWRYGEDLPRLKIQLLELGFEYEALESQADKYNKLSGAQKEKVDNLVKSIDDLTKSYRSNTLEILQAKSGLQDLADAIDKVVEQTHKLAEYIINNEIEALKRVKEQARETYQLKIDRIQKEIDRLEKRNELLNEEEMRQQKLLDLEKQREKLENIKEQRNVRMLIDGEWTWVADPRKLREETERLQDMQEDYFQWEEDLRRKKEIQKLKDQISALQTELKNEEQKYDTQIKNLQLFISEYKDRQSEFYGQRIIGLNRLVESIKDIEEKSYDERINALDDFVDRYNRLINSMSATTTSSTSKSSGGGGGSSSGGGTSPYNATATIPGTGKVGVNIDSSGKTTTKGLPVGTVIHTGGGDYVVKEVKPDGSYVGQKVPSYDIGTNNHPGGLAYIHKDELINLPKGTEVFPKDISKQLLSLVTNPITLMNNLIPRMPIPQFSIPNTGGGGGIHNHYHIGKIDVKTNDAGRFMSDLARKVANR